MQGNNTYTGDTAIVSGTLTGSGGSPGSNIQGNLHISSGAQVSFHQTVAATYGGQISGAGSITKEGDPLTLVGVNSYSGGTTLENGTLSISLESNLGSSSGNLTLQTGTILEITGTLGNLSRDILLNGGIETIKVAASNSATISGNITGSGTFFKVGSGILKLSGENTYSGGTVIDEGILQGTTIGLQGTITLSSGTLIFSQTASGTYSGTISGAGSLNLIGGPYNFSGNSSLLTGPVSLTNANLQLSGQLGSSIFTVGPNSILQGSGSVIAGEGFVNSGKVIPGVNGVSQLNIEGDFSFSGGELITNLTPTSTPTLSISSVATLTDGTVNVMLSPGFYGVTIDRTILTASSVNSPFTNVILDQRIVPFPGTDGFVYNPTSVQLFARVMDIFLDFSFANANERATAENINALARVDELSDDLIAVLDSMSGLSISQIGDALDQIHPAAMGAFSEVSVALGSRLLSSLHRIHREPCSSDQSSQFWIQGVGTWLDLEPMGMQIGSSTKSYGVVGGFDFRLFDFWTIGIGGSYLESDLKWSLNRGYSYITGRYGCIYTDFSLGRFLLGGSGYVGKNGYKTNRQIHFSTVDRQATSSFTGFDSGAQMIMAYFFGTSRFALYPYGSVDYLYLANHSFQEEKANSLNLTVNNYSGSTLRGSLGGMIKFSEQNRTNTLSLSPLISLGYVLEIPLHRSRFRAKFADESVFFTTRGWNRTWQLINLKFGLDLTYKCFTLGSNYSLDFSADRKTSYKNQSANLQAKVSF